MKRYRDIIAAVVLLVFAGVYALLTSTVEVKNFATIGGARLVPYICAVLLAICSVFIFAIGLRELKKEKAQPAEAEKKDKVEEVPSNYKNVAITLALVALYALLFSPLGFIPSTIVFVTLQAFVLMPKRSPKMLLQAFIVGTVTSVLVYLLFTNLFYVMLPTGVLW